MMSIVAKLRRSSGQTMTEYAMILATVVIVGYVAFQQFGNTLVNKPLANVDQKIDGALGGGGGGGGGGDSN
ncbi:MAG TPA: hypothetical protein VEF03_02915 [Candidatus Binataceae bacterium]|nr:hypothetical protein [Candidatus Binataceae bacterium]